MSLWKADPRFTNYVPRTAEEAVGRFVRCRDNGLSAMMIPECLVDCSRGLNNTELDAFEQWIVNPSGPVSLTAPLVQTTAMSKSNNDIYDEAVRRYEETRLVQDCDEKVGELDQLPVVPALLTATERAVLARKPASVSVGPADTQPTSGEDPCRLGAAFD